MPNWQICAKSNKILCFSFQKAWMWENDRYTGMVRMKKNCRAESNTHTHTHTHTHTINDRPFFSLFSTMETNDCSQDLSHAPKLLQSALESMKRELQCRIWYVRTFHKRKQKRKDSQMCYVFETETEWPFHLPLMILHQRYFVFCFLFLFFMTHSLPGFFSF
jgi:hypothetical protein